MDINTLCLEYINTLFAVSFES